MATFSIRESLRSGWELTKANFGFVTIAILATGALVSGVAGGEGLHTGFNGAVPIGYLAESIVSIPLIFVCAVLVQFVYMSLYLRLADGAELKLQEMFPNFRTYWNYFAVIFLVGLITIAGLIVFIIPGIYFALRFGFASLLVIDEGLGPIEAMKKSAILTRGIKWKLLGFWLAIAGLSILAIIPLCLGFLITIPVTYFSLIRIYRKRLLDTGSEPAFEVPLTPPHSSEANEVITA